MVKYRLVEVGHQPQQVPIGTASRQREVPDVVVRVPLFDLAEVRGAAAHQLGHQVQRWCWPQPPVCLHDLAHDGRVSARLLEQQHSADVGRAGRCLEQLPGKVERRDRLVHPWPPTGWCVTEMSLHKGATARH